MAKKRGRRRKMPAPLSFDPFDDGRDLSKRKLRQLCRQVERAMSTALADDSRLLDLRVETVLPWPNASRLLVAVYPSEPDAEIDRETIRERLAEAKADLRTIVAEAIHRKRAPDLSFEVFSPEEI